MGWQKHLPKKKKEQVEELLDRKIVATRRGRYSKYLIKWTDLSHEDSMWISEEEMRTLDERKWEKFEARCL